ncbi:MAG: PQQ-binding-like beta-propeller repeat protein, partial [Planctomycetales bacterium]|nr:PQQ-binding-like beta-propeller repeat protein [Planctomycetales bacterium]
TRQLNDWSQHPPREVWRKAVGPAWSSFATQNGIAYTMEQREDLECTVAYRISDGGEAWAHAEPLRFERSAAGPGPRSTPAVVNDQVISVGATGRINCLDVRDGTVQWGADLTQDEPLAHGIACSPLVWQSRVFVCPVAKQGPALAAYDLNDGSLVWQAGTGRASYSSPQLWNTDDGSQILLYYDGRLESFAVDDGKLLWSHSWPNDTDTYASQPVLVDEHQVLVTTGYGTGGALLEVLPNTETGWSVEERWTSRDLKTKFSTAIVHEQTIYALDNGIMVSVDLSTGKLNWKSGRYGFGQLLGIGDKLLVQSERGFVAVVTASPNAFQELARVDALDGISWNVPTLSWPHLLLRNDQQAVCWELEASGEAATP